MFRYKGGWLGWIRFIAMAGWVVSTTETKAFELFTVSHFHFVVCV